MMNVLCLMPTYGRRASLLNNSIACFVTQAYKNKHLLIYDDSGILEKTTCDLPDVSIMSTTKRASSIGAKYNEMLRYAASATWHAVIVWDDDDIYLPNHIKNHAETLYDHSWSKPATIVSAYHDPPAIEDASGRFHGSIAIRRPTLEQVGGWIETTRATFDQEMLQRLGKESPPGKTVGLPQYVYRWQGSQSGHCSGGMGDPDWYEKYQPDSTLPIERLYANYDQNTRNLIAELSDKKQQREMPE